MKAAICERYGAPDVLKIAEIPKPVPKDNEVLIRVRAATVTLGDCELRAFRVAGWIWLPLRLAMGITRPRQPVLGQELAGEVEAVGRDVDAFKPGDRVFGSTGFRMGAYAEYALLPASHPLAPVPAGLSFEQAACLPVGGINAMHFLRKADLQPGEQILINGAGGSIGTLAVQLARNIGAEVTAVDRGDKLDILSGIGADHVIDYTRQDFASLGRRYDVIVDVVGKAPYSGCIASLRPNGRLVLGNPYLVPMLRGLWTSRTSDKKVYVQLAGETREDLEHLGALAVAGEITPVIDRTVALDDIAEAHRYVDAGNKRGCLVVVPGV